MRRTLRRSLAAMGLMGLLAASALAAGIGSSGTARAANCYSELVVYVVDSGPGDVIVYEARTCEDQGVTTTTWTILN